MADEKKAIIQPTPNGPYMVRDLKKFKNSKGDNISVSPVMALCRCGGSKNKPFCDGTHLKNGFTDEKESDREPDRMDDYDGVDISIHDNRGVCSRRGYCTDNAPKVFKAGESPWIDPDGQDSDKTAAVIKTCPSGALSYSKDGELHKDFDHEPGIIVSKDGPYDVQGNVLFDDVKGNTPESEEHYTLCRCGQSKNKPFCNGQHWHVKFKDPKN